MTELKIKLRCMAACLAAACFALLLAPAASERVQAAGEGTSGKDYVVDNADILTDSEEDKLQKKCEAASKNCKTDIIILTMNEGLDGTIMDNYVREFMQESYGYDGVRQDPEAVVYAIDMRSRADRLVTSGRARHEAITQGQLDSIRRRSEEKLTDGLYYRGCVLYIKGIERYMNTSIWYRMTLGLPVKIGVALAAAVISVMIMMRSAKAQMTAGAVTYSGGQFNIRRQQDDFINTTMTSRQISSSSGSGGGGGGGGGGNSGSSGGHF